MGNTLIYGVLALILGLAPGPRPFPVAALGSPQAAGGGSCTLSAPKTYDWQMYNATCSGSACANGGNVTSVPDAVASNTLSNTGATPTWATSAYGSKGAVVFSNSVGTDLSLTTGYSPTTSVSTFIIFKPTTVNAIRALLGPSAGSNAFELRINASGNLEILNAGITSIATNSTALVASTKYAYAATYNQTTGAYGFYKMSAGSYTADGSGTGATSTWSNPINRVGTSGGDPIYDGDMLEMIVYTGTWDATALGQLATYAQCQAGV